MSDGPAARSIGKGAWRLAAEAPGGALSVNAYLLEGEGAFCLVDAGPGNLGPDLIRQARSLCSIEAIEAIVLLDDSPLAYSALRLWREAGFHGSIHADWRVTTSLSLGGLCAEAGWAPFRELRDEAFLFQGTALAMRVLRPAAAHGAIALLHEGTKLLFTGRTCSSLGKDLPLACSDPSLAAQRAFSESVGYSGHIDLDAAGPSADQATACPRFGSLLPPPLAEAALALADAPVHACTEPPVQLHPLMTELESLRSSNYSLKEAMIGASDAALRDPASGLYGRGYADAFIKSLCQRKSDFSAAFVRIDRIKELNRLVGPQSVDLAMKDLATLLQEKEPEAFVFRWTGPVFLMLINGQEDLHSRLEGIRAAVEKGHRFVQPITVSVALVRSGELGEDAFPRLQAFARERLKLLDRKGGNSILEKSDIPLEEKALVLALDADTLFLDFLVESFEREGFRTLGAARGGEALELMDRIKPELVIADLSLPQFDAFQIRLRMRGSVDLHDIPFILLAAGKSDEVIARAHSLGIYHVFEKPVSMVELLGVSRSLLARSEDGA